MKKINLKSGFTLAELSIGMAIFLVISVLLTQGIISILKFTSQINTNSELTLFTSKIINTLAVDIDEYFIDLSASDNNVLKLYNASRTKNITYTINQIDRTDPLLSGRSISSELDGHIFSITRKTDNEEQNFKSDKFVLFDPKFIKSNETNSCDFIPAVTFRSKIIYLQKNNKDLPSIDADIQTTFSSPVDMGYHLQNC